MTDKRVLIDTSVWIDYFRKANSELILKVDLLLDNDRVAVPKIIIAELLHGARDKKEAIKIQDYFSSLHSLDQKEDIWEEAGLLAFDIKKKGYTINLTDCYIACIAKRHRCTIYSLDKHFSILDREGFVELIG